MSARRPLRVGVIGANPDHSWAKRGHLPAILALPDLLELTAVCTTRMSTASESADIYGARHAFDDYRQLIACDEVDAVLVSVRVQRHFEPTMAALASGKHVYTEWPLGADLGEAERLAAAAREAPGKAIIGLQDRHTPLYLRLRELVAEGALGEVLSVQVGSCGGGLADKDSTAAWRADIGNGAHNGTIGFGHLLEPVCHAVGELVEVSGVWHTQLPSWQLQDTGASIEATAPDAVFMQGTTADGVVIMAYEMSVPAHPSGYRLEVYGTEGAAVVAGPDRRGELKLLLGRRGAVAPEAVAVPPRLTRVLHDRPRDRPFFVAQMWSHLAEAIATDGPVDPDFEVALERHRLIDAVRRSSESGRRQAVAGV